MSTHSNRVADKPWASFSTSLLCFLFLIALAPVPAAGSFTGPYAPGNFSLTNTNLNAADLTPGNGFAVISPEGWLVLTGSNTGSGLFPGTETDFTIASKGTGQVSFDWVYSTLDDPTFDIGGYILGNNFQPLADENGLSGSVSFQVTLGQLFGFRVRTLDNTFEPGVLTIKSFAAPSAAGAVPEPGTSALLALALAGGLIGRRCLRRMNSSGERIR